MAKSKWEKLAGETGEEVPSGRLGRMAKLSGLGVKVGASAVAGKLGARFLPRSKSKKRDIYKRRIEKNAERVVEVLGRLKGASMKVGQILSADPDLMPPHFSEMLTSLQTQAPPMTYNTVRQQIETALDVPIETVFRFFDPEPIGAASIGQVHRGTLMTGEDVAVKVQYPGILESIESDLRNLGSLMSLGRVMVNKERLDQYLEEVRTAVLEESNYEIEAENLRRAHEDLVVLDGVRVPEPFEEWTRKPVLVMEYIEGTKLDDALTAMGPGAERRALLERFIYIYVWMFHQRQELHADPHPGNFLLCENGDLAVLDFGCVKHFEPELTDGILKILDAVWGEDPERAARYYQEIGFGGKNADPSIFDADLIKRYHELILEPFIVPGPFHFGGWQVTAKAQRFIMKNPKMIKLVPPADLILYFRVLSGVKGLLTKLDEKVDLRAPAIEIAKERGVYTGD